MRDRGSSRALPRFLAALLVVGLLAPLGPAGADTLSELKEARRRLRVIERDLEVQQGRLASVRAEQESVTTQIAEAYAQLLQVKEAIRVTRGDIKRKNQRIDALQERLNRRARDVYIEGPGGIVEFVLEADSLTDLSDRVAFLDVLSQADANLAVGVHVEREGLLGFQETLGDQVVQQAELISSLAEKQRELDATFAVELRITQRIEDKFAEAEDVVGDLARRHRQELLAEAAALARTGGGPPLDADGPFYYCPVDPPRSYINDFGYPRPGGRTHQGNDIFAPEGTLIRAPFPGTASESSNTLGGLAVYVHHADGTYVYNAHLSRYYGVSGHVDTGDPIGYVGNTGNASGGPTHDHFEYHPGGGSAVSPYPYLNEVC